MRCFTWCVFSGADVLVFDNGGQLRGEEDKKNVQSNANFV